MMIHPQVANARHCAASYCRFDFEKNRDNWDRWLMDTEHADATQLSAHLDSFRAYHADVTLHVVRDDSGALLAGAGILSWAIPGIGVPFGIGAGGPVGDAKYWPQLLDGVSDWCSSKKWMCLELRPGTPIEDDQARDSLVGAEFHPVEKVFAPVSTLGRDLRVSIGGSTQDELLRSFRRQTRQHVLRSLEEGYELELPFSESELHSAVDFFCETTLENGLPLGPRARFLAAVLDLVDSKTGYVALVKQGKRTLAGGVFARSGRAHRCYRLATRRDPTYRRSAYFLHWQAMLQARREQVNWYHLTGRSTPSVYQFKRGFRPEELELMAPHRRVFRPALMRSIETVQPIAMKTARRILAAANRMRGRS